MTTTRQPPHPTLTRKQSLDGVPILNTGVSSTNNAETQTIIISVRKLRGTGFFSRFQPAVSERRVKLDATGSFVFGQIDGRRSTRDIIGAFARQYTVNRREAELSCVAFLKSLVHRGVISIAIP
ncbi:MAG: PqqD family protein [Verrucomicrobia bacterium]|nr:PqqD family protein [Verrucomicrobiota bacterium]